MKDYRSEREYALYSGGCGCSLGREECNCCGGKCPAPMACELPEPPMFDRSPLASLAIACALVLGAGTVGWVLAVPYLTPVLLALLEKA